MTIAVGTTNIVKIQAIEEAIKDYPLLAQAKVASFSVDSEVSKQPISLEETIRGAKNRAKNAFSACEAPDYSFGIENGIFQAFGTQTGFISVCVCSIFNGENYYIGFSTGFEVPPQILSLILNQKMDMGQACYHSGITNNTMLGSAEGLIGILTNGRVNRKEYTKQSVVTALIQIEHQRLFSE